MARYVISDHHFGHSNIIEYCDRPFTSVGEMDSALLDRHYETVDPDDLLVHLGDVAMDMRDGQETIEYFQQLGGDLLLQGNHDVGLDPAAAPFPVLDSCVLEHGDYRFYCTHRPEDVPDDWDDWVIHGHIHNNDPETYPFVAPRAQRVNVSCELLGFRPIALETLTGVLDAATTSLRDVAAATALVEE
ncbi:metallophosphoesterase [Halomicrobium sp. IBSBa]|uniref:metallophosphoesterase n=1 Tax=Halomicrobium sp. IBSBa TaxID=2778916 RepID=UPI001ABF5C3B|nr:metallophosphoesterase [Halomicrobium sp. IBSBa]MBO4247359.1 metallophosphoesterase [Halomicrobium sp. IBSBa]